MISVVNQKGGVGKTTTAVNLASALAVSERSVLLVDMDPQGNATSGLGMDKKRLLSSVYDLMTGQAEPGQTVQDTSIRFLKLFPAKMDLYRTEFELTATAHKERMPPHGLQPHFRRLNCYRNCKGPPNVREWVLCGISQMINQ